MPDRRVTILVVILAAGLVIAGLALPGITGGALLLIVAIALATLTTSVRSRGAAQFDSRNWAVRILVIMALAAVGLFKLFNH